MSGPAPAPARPRSTTIRLTVAVAVVVFALDQLTKAWAVHRLSSGDIDLFWTLRLRLTYNSGMAFSRGRGFGPVIGVLALVVIVVLVLAARRGTSKLGAVAVGMVIGGAAGNICDRLLRDADGFLQGRVIDFIDLQWWPVFNVADSAIVVGGLMLVAVAWRTGRPPA